MAARDPIAKGLPQRQKKTRAIKPQEITDDQSLRALAVLANNPQLLYCPYTPTEKQREFLDAANKYTRVLYGGAAGGGKSFALLLAALQYVNNPFYTCLILRRTLQDLRLAGALIDLSHAWLDKTDAKWDGQTHTWRFPRGGIIQFGYLETSQDKYRYQSAQYHTIAIDEASQIDPDDVIYLTSRLRTPQAAKLPLPRLLLASNPGGRAHTWLFDKFVNPETRLKAYQFVEAKYTDNPHIDQENYGETLDALPDLIRRQLKYGEWIQDGESNVYRFTSSNIVSRLPTEGRTVISVDLGWHDDTAIVILREYEGVAHIILAIQDAHLTISEVADRLILLIAKYGPDKIVIDTGGGGKQISEELRARHHIPCTAATKTAKADTIALLNDDLQKDKLVIHESCSALLEQMQALVWKDSKHQLEHPSQPNHLCDAMLYAWREALHYQHEPSIKKENEVPAWAVVNNEPDENEEYGPLGDIYG